MDKIYEIQKDLFKLEQGNESVELYFHKLKGFWDGMRALEPVIKCTCGATKEWDSQIEKTRLIQFLMGLHSSYTAARGHLLMMNPWPTVNQAYMLIKQEEKQRQVHCSATPIAMMVNAPKPPYLNHNFQRTSADKSGILLECTYCHGKNHTKDKCYKLVGYPSDHPFNPNNRGRKKTFTKPSPGQFGHFNSGHSNNKSSQVMQVSETANPSPDVSSFTNFSTYNATANWNSQMEALQNQMNSLRQCILVKAISQPASLILRMLLLLMETMSWQCHHIINFLMVTMWQVQPILFHLLQICLLMFGFWILELPIICAAIKMICKICIF